MSDRKRVLIVGGVAGGATCAARLRRLEFARQMHRRKIQTLYRKINYFEYSDGT